MPGFSRAGGAQPLASAGAWRPYGSVTGGANSVVIPETGP
jgi:hypothetical protein